MGTSNFYAKNTNTIYYLGDEVLVNLDFVIDDIKEFGKEFFKKEKIYFLDTDESERDGLRSFPGTIFGWAEDSLSYMGESIGIQGEIIMRDGYYSGINFDYNLFGDTSQIGYYPETKTNLLDDEEKQKLIETWAEAVEYFQKKKPTEKQKLLLLKRLEKKIEKITGKIEEYFGKISEYNETI